MWTHLFDLIRWLIGVASSPRADWLLGDAAERDRRRGRTPIALYRFLSRDDHRHLFLSNHGTRAKANGA